MPGLVLLVPGGTGQLGSDLEALSSADVEVRAPGSAELDITQTGAVIEAVATIARYAKESGKQAVVVNAAAYTAVDAAESEEERAFAVNVDGPRVLAAACSSRRIPLVHVSTDYVFPGDADRPYEPEDPLGPRTAYGRTKAAGEDAVLGSGAQAWIVRTAWLYGAGGGNFVKTMARLERERETLSVVDDQHGSPTWSADLAACLLELTMRIAAGEGPDRTVLHCVSGEDTTWHEFARAIFTELGADPERVLPCTSAQFPQTAPRPAYSVLADTSWRAAGLTPMRPWREALHDFVTKHADTLRQPQR